MLEAIPGLGKRLVKTGRRRKRDEELARLWSKAAVPVRRFDPDLANRRLLKSQFRISPDRWEADEVTEKKARNRRDRRERAGAAVSQMMSFGSQSNHS
jgi:hypothetical protein